MQAMKKFIFFLGVLVFLVIMSFVVINNYSWIFSRTIEGQIFQVERVVQPTVVVDASSNGNKNAIMYSFAVAIRDKEGKIFTSSSEDRQWAVAQKGMCVQAKFYPYPPWDLDKGGTYQNARMLSLRDCPPGFGPLPETPAVQPAVPAPTDPAAPADGKK